MMPLPKETKSSGKLLFPILSIIKYIVAMILAKPAKVNEPIKLKITIAIVKKIVAKTIPKTIKSGDVQILKM